MKISIACEEIVSEVDIVSAARHVGFYLPRGTPTAQICSMLNEITDPSMLQKLIRKLKELHISFALVDDVDKPTMLSMTTEEPEKKRRKRASDVTSTVAKTATVVTRPSMLTPPTSMPVEKESIIAPKNAKWFEAARRGDNETIAKLIQEGADINDRNQFGATALDIAAKFDHLETVKILYRARNEETVIEPFVFEFLFKSPKTSSAATSLTIASAGKRLPTQSRKTLPPQENVNPTLVEPLSLFDAVRQGNIKEVKAILAGGADVNLLDKNSQSALDIAAKLKNVDMVKLLLKKDIRNIGKTLQTQAKDLQIRELLFLALWDRIENYLREIKTVFGENIPIVREMDNMLMETDIYNYKSLVNLQQKIVNFSTRYLNPKHLSKLGDEDWRCNNDVDLAQQYAWPNDPDSVQTVEEIPANQFIRLRNVCWNVQTLIGFITDVLHGANKNILDPTYTERKKTDSLVAPPPMWSNEAEKSALLQHPSGSGSKLEMVLSVVDAKQNKDIKKPDVDYITDDIAENFFHKIGSILWARGAPFEKEIEDELSLTELAEWEQRKRQMLALEMPKQLSEVVNAKIEYIKSRATNLMAAYWNEMNNDQKRAVVKLTEKSETDLISCMKGSHCAMTMGKSLINAYNLWATANNKPLVVVEGLNLNLRSRNL